MRQETIYCNVPACHKEALRRIIKMERFTMRQLVCRGIEHVAVEYGLIKTTGEIDSLVPQEYSIDQDAAR